MGQRVHKNACQGREGGRASVRAVALAKADARAVVPVKTAKATSCQG